MYPHGSLFMHTIYTHTRYYIGFKINPEDISASHRLRTLWLTHRRPPPSFHRPPSWRRRRMSGSRARRPRAPWGPGGLRCHATARWWPPRRDWRVAEPWREKPAREILSCLDPAECGNKNDHQCYHHHIIITINTSSRFCFSIIIITYTVMGYFTFVVILLMPIFFFGWFM